MNSPNTDNMQTSMWTTSTSSTLFNLHVWPLENGMIIGSCTINLEWPWQKISKHLKNIMFFFSCDSQLSCSATFRRCRSVLILSYSKSQWTSLSTSPDVALLFANTDLHQGLSLGTTTTRRSMWCDVGMWQCSSHVEAYASCWKTLYFINFTDFADISEARWGDVFSASLEITISNLDLGLSRWLARTIQQTLDYKSMIPWSTKIAPPKPIPPTATQNSL